MAASSLFYFCKYVLGFRDMEIKPHYSVCKFLQSNIENDLLVLLPRGTFKSSIVTVGMTMWELATRNLNLRFVLSSYKENQTIGWLGQIKSIAETNHSFQALYGDWSDNAKRWQATAVTLPGKTDNMAHPSIAATSTKGTEVSQHCDRFVLDDIQTDENVKTKDMVDAVEHYAESIISLLDPQKSTGRPGPRRFVGTRWGYGDVYGRLIHRNKTAKKAGKPEPLRTYIRKAYTKTSTFFPKRFPREVLDYMRDTMHMTDYFFSCQYLNDPQPEGTEVFPLSSLGWFWFDDSSGRGKMVVDGVVTELPPVLNFFTTIDPSVGDSADSDWMAMDTVGVDSTWRIFVWHILRKRYGGNTDEMISDMFMIQRSYKPARMGIESVAFQKTLIYGFDKRSREEGKWFPVEQLKTDTMISKDMRIRGFQPFVKGKKVFVRVGINTDLTLPCTELLYYLVDGQDTLVDEMIKFPTGETKDCIDALAYSPQLIFPAGETPKRKIPPPNSLAAIFEQFASRADRKAGLSLR